MRVFSSKIQHKNYVIDKEGLATENDVEDGSFTIRPT